MATSSTIPFPAKKAQRTSRYAKSKKFTNSCHRTDPDKHRQGPPPRLKQRVAAHDMLDQIVDVGKGVQLGSLMNNVDTRL